MKISIPSTSPPAAVSKNWMKWKKMEIIAQQRKKKTMRYGTARQVDRKLGYDKAAKPQTSTAAINKYLTM